MFDQTATVVIERPGTEEDLTLENVVSIVTTDNGTMYAHIKGEGDIREVGWDCRIRDVYSAAHYDIGTANEGGKVCPSCGDHQLLSTDQHGMWQCPGCCYTEFHD